MRSDVNLIPQFKSGSIFNTATQHSIHSFHTSLERQTDNFIFVLILEILGVNNYFYGIHFKEIFCQVVHKNIIILLLVI